MTDIATEAAGLRFYAEPAKIDGMIARLSGEEARLARQLERVREAKQRLSEIYVARRWTRAYLVNNADGHVHSSTHCSTCFPTTQFMWLTEESGKCEDEIIERAGERACTTCYADAPVDALKRKSKFQSEPEIERQKREAERAEQRKAKDVKAITNPDGSALIGGPHRDHFKTERAAEIAAVKALAELETDRSADGSEHPYAPKNRELVELVTAAIAAKHGTAEADVLAKLKTKAAAKIKRDEAAHQKDRRERPGFWAQIDKANAEYANWTEKTL